MKPLRIFRHIECEGPGYLGQFLDRMHIPFHIVCIDQNDPVPEQLDDISGLVFMGGPMSVNDDLPWIDQELRLIQQAFARDLPVLGHCLGGQLVAKALGGNVTRNAVKEIGWFHVTPTSAGQPWFGDSSGFDAFHWHGETFSLPAGATLLLRSEYCSHQAFAIGNSLGLQCHVEITADMVPQWADLYAHELSVHDAPAIQTKKQMTERLTDRITALHTTADRLYTKWIEGLGE